MSTYIANFLAIIITIAIQIMPFFSITVILIMVVIFIVLFLENYCE